MLWCSDNQRLAITDWTGSSIAEIYLVEFTAPTKASRLDVKDIEKITEQGELEGHCYYEALKWEAPTQLLIRVFGHTDENPSHGFTYYLSVNTLTGSAKLLRKELKELGFP